MRINPAAMRDLREARGWTLSDLQTEMSAIRGGDRPVSLGYLSELESGRKSGSPRMAKLLAQALRCSMATIVVAPEYDDEGDAEVVAG